MTTPFIQTLIKVAVMTLSLTSAVTAAHPAKIVYLTPDIHFSFWHHIAAGIATEASKNGFEFHALSSDNDGAIQLKNAQHAIAHGATGLVLTPTDSATAPAVLALAKQAHIPVVIADVGTNSGEYVSYISSDNYTGAYKTGLA